MKKMMMSMLLLISFSANALPTFDVTSALVGVMISELAHSKYNTPLPACASNKDHEGFFSDGKSNYSFAIPACDYEANPTEYKLKL